MSYLIDLIRTREVDAAEPKLKYKAREILRCYRHSWDVFSESIQNSVDAINRRFGILNDPDHCLYSQFDNYRLEHASTSDQAYTGCIRITLDLADRTIQIEDNGVGIASENLGRFLLPEESGKVMGRDYGFKGYGLTFVSFISHEFSLRSRFFASNETYEISLNGLFDWLIDQTNIVPFPSSPIPEPTLASIPLDGISANTVVKFKLDDCYKEKFSAIAAADSALEYITDPSQWDRFIHVLRTRTAIGNTNLLFNRPPYAPIDVEATVIFADGTQETRAIDFSFSHPRDNAEISINSYDFADYVQQFDTLPNKTFRGLYCTETDRSVGTREPISFDVAVLAANTGLLSRIEANLLLDEVGSKDIGISYGIHLSINGMPTGIRIDDWDNKSNDRKRFYAVVDASLQLSNQLDSGRKGISGYFANLISEDVWGFIRTAHVGGSETFNSYATKYLDQSSIPSILPSQPLPIKVRMVREAGTLQEQQAPLT